MRTPRALKRQEALIALAFARSSTGPSPASGEIVRLVAFSFSTPSPLVLQAVGPSLVLNRAAILVTTPFDDAAATLRLGTTASPALVLDAGAAERLER